MAIKRLELVGEVETGPDGAAAPEGTSSDCQTQPVAFENCTCHKMSATVPVAGMGLGPPITVPTAPFPSVPVTVAFVTPWLRRLAGLAMELTATVCPTVNSGVTAAGAGVELLVVLLDPELLDPELLDPELLEELPLLPLEPVPLDTVCPGCAMSALLELNTTNVP